MGTINYSGRMPDFSIGSTTIQNPNTGQTTTFNPSGGVSLHNPGSRYGTYSGTTGDGTTYLGNPQSTITSTGEVYHGSSAPWQIQGQHGGRRQAPLSGTASSPGVSPSRKSADDEIAEAIVDTIFAPIEGIANILGGKKDKPKKDKKKTAPKKTAPKKDVTKRSPSSFYTTDREDAATERLKAKLRERGQTWSSPKKKKSGGLDFDAGDVGSVVGSLLGSLFNEGGPVYKFGGGAMPMPNYQISGPRMPMQQRQGPLGALVDFGKGKALSAGLEAAFPGGGIAAEAAQEVIPTFFEEGGKVPWWKAVKKKVLGETKSKDFWENVGQGKAGHSKKPAYKQIGGMTPGPLGMSDMLAAGKGKDVAKVSYKKKGGQIEDQVEISYHAPLAAKPKGE